MAGTPALQLKIFDLDGKLLAEVAMPALGSVFDLGGSWDSECGFFGFVSYTIPPTVYQVSLDGVPQNGPRWNPASIPTNSRSISSGLPRGTALAFPCSPSPGRDWREMLKARRCFPGMAGSTWAARPYSIAMPCCCCWSAAAYTLTCSCAAATNLEKSGIAPACWQTNKMSSTTLSLRLNT